MTTNIIEDIRMENLLNSRYCDLAMTLIDMSDGSQAIIDRVMNAVELAEDGHIVGSGNYVLSQTGSGEAYEIRFEGMPRSYQCSCPAFSYHPVEIEGLGRLCKHALAAHIKYLAGE